MRITGKRGRRRIIRACLATLLLGLTGMGSGCVKRTVNVPVSARVREAKTATLEGLLSQLDRYTKQVVSLSSSSVRVTFTSGRLDSGQLQEYRSAPAYILLKRPDMIRLNVQNPLTKTTIVELESRGEEFHVWYPRENKFFTGRNDVREFEVEGQPGFTARPIHLFEAILPRSVAPGASDERIAMAEEQDASAKYYVLSLYHETGGPRIIPVRRLWIDRSNLAVARMETFSEDGAKTSIIDYSGFVETEGLILPLSVRIERPVDKYMLSMQFKAWRVNPDLPDTAFVLMPPEGAQRVILKERGRSQNN
jgi:outer membrane lipoprotein-sorting protein